MARNTIIDGIAASEHLDSSGESLSIKGMDISSLGGPDSILNWEHGSKDRPSQVVGKVTFARKILEKSDAKSKREMYFWNKVKKPFVYIKAELFDGLGHSGAEDVAAMLKYKNKDRGEDSRLVVGFSVEGGKIEKKGMTVTKSIARDIAITVKPCNKVCDAEVIEGDVDEDFLYKNQKYDCEILKKGNFVINSKGYRELILEKIAKGDVLKIKTRSDEEEKDEKKTFGSLADKENWRAGDQIKYKDKKSGPPKWDDVYKTDNNMRKALIASMMGGTSDSKTGMAALAPEYLEGKKTVKTLQKIKKNENKINYTNKRMFKSENVKINPEHGRTIAQAYDQMIHDPNNPEVQNSYDSLINETIQQYNDIVKGGLKISRIEPGMENPYKNSKELHNDILNNNHLWYFPTEQGFGTENESSSDHPMLRPTGIMHGENELLANDIFRIVHDINGHHRGGLSDFGPRGEHRAYLTHKKMYSPLAAKAMATETLGQNSWVNFGPYGEQNRKNPINTVYADQKAGLLPDEIINGLWHIDEKNTPLQKGQAPIQFTKLVGQSRPESDVPEITTLPQAYRFQREMGEDSEVSPSTHGLAVVTSEGKRRTMSAQPGQTKEQMMETKGRGNYPTTKYHEGFHDHINKIDEKYPKLKGHSQSLIRHALDNFFHPQDRLAMTRYLKDIQGYKENINEEALTHFSDFRTNPDLRDALNSYNDLGEEGNIQRQTRIKRAMKKLLPWADSITEKDMKKIHSEYLKRDKGTRPVVQKIKSGASGLKD